MKPQIFPYLRKLDLRGTFHKSQVQFALKNIFWIDGQAEVATGLPNPVPAMNRLLFFIEHCDFHQQRSDWTL